MYDSSVKGVIRTSVAIGANGYTCMLKEKDTNHNGIHMH